jgi:hypothetical protein
MVDGAIFEILLPMDLEPSPIGDVRHRFGYGRHDFVWSTGLSLAVPEPRLPVLGLAVLTALIAGKRRLRQ